MQAQRNLTLQYILSIWLIADMADYAHQILLESAMWEVSHQSLHDNFHLSSRELSTWMKRFISYLSKAITWDNMGRQSINKPGIFVIVLSLRAASNCPRLSSQTSQKSSHCLTNSIKTSKFRTSDAWPWVSLRQIQCCYGYGFPYLRIVKENF